MSTNLGPARPAKKSAESNFAQEKNPDLGFMTLVEASAAVRTPVRTLRLWIAQGRVPAFRPGKRVLVRRADLVRLIEAAALPAPL